MAEKGDRVVGWPKGVDTRAPDHALPEGTLRQAINVDILPDGRVRRRQGFTNVLAGDYHSLHGADNGKFGLAVRDGELHRLTHNGSTLVAQTVATGLMLGRPMGYAYVNGLLYYSNGLDSGKIGETGSVAPWTVEAPNARPTVSELSGGLLSPGQYQISLTYVTAAMEQSLGLPVPAVVSVANSNAGLLLSGIPQPQSPTVAYIRVYATTNDGAVLYRVADLPVGTTSYQLLSMPGGGMVLRTGAFGPLPPGAVLAYYNGRLYSAAGNVLWESEPFNYGVCNLAEGFTVFPADITMLAPVLDGIYVASDVTYFLSGPNLKQASMRTVLPYGAAKHAVTKRSDNDTQVWLSHRGLVEGGDGGKVKNLQEAHVAVPEHDTGALLFREQNGVKQFIGLGAGGQQGSVAKLSATDFAEAEIRRGGVSSLREQIDSLSWADVAEAEVA